MVRGGSIRRLLAAAGVGLWMLTFSAGAVLADESTECNVDVSPASATAGESFVFDGTGFKPNELVLRKVGGEPINHQLDLGENDPWEVTVRSRTGDEGSWTATFLDPDGICTATVGFRVTLTETDAIDDIAKAVGDAPAPFLLYLTVIVLGFGGGTVIGRRINSRGIA
jgi:hypothetical protein